MSFLRTNLYKVLSQGKDMPQSSTWASMRIIQFFMMSVINTEFICQSSENSSSEIMKIFEPLPQVLVTSPCSWHLQLNEDTLRIPGNFIFHFRLPIDVLDEDFDNLCISIVTTQVFWIWDFVLSLYSLTNQKEDNWKPSTLNTVCFRDNYWSCLSVSGEKVQ